jgi:peptidoglycan LD-endopeptidase CwlK
MPIKPFLFLAFCCLSASLFAQSKTDNTAIAQKLVAAYPNFLAKAEKNAVVWKDGTSSVLEDGKTPATYTLLLENADLYDQMRQICKRGDYHTPVSREEPGRVRSEAFFKKMYGSNAAEVKKSLTTIDFFGAKLQVTTINGVDKKLALVRDELAQKPELKKYLTTPGGTFLWRIISKTNRLSMHSFGIAIDINTKYSDYWQWAGKNLTEESTEIPYKNRIPSEIVTVFEKYGFVWGGRWHHYDTMHFEYRPELF